MKNIIILLIVLFGVISNLSAQTVLTVTKTTDVDPFDHPYNFDDGLCDLDMYGTLQWAIRKANDTGGNCVIEFSIAGTGQQEILLNFELPMITNNVILNATTQSGYSFGNPMIKINGQTSLRTCFQSYNCIVQIEGFHITSFQNYGILANTGSNSQILNNVITSIENLTTAPAMGIRILRCDNATVYGNFIGTDSQSTLGIGIEDYGLLLQASNNNFIGGTTNNEQNIIANCGIRGVWLVSSIGVKLSGNLIYNNPIGIFLQLSNQNIVAPVIENYIGGVLSGISEPSDTIEIFGSTGVENTNEYISNTITDASGNWSVLASTSFDYYIATATDISNNTSQFSNAYSSEIISVNESGLPIWQDGKIYLKISSSSSIDLMSYPIIPLDINDSILNVLQYFGTIEIEKPFVDFNTPKFDRIYKISFTDTLGVNDFIDSLKLLSFIEYSEKVPAIYQSYEPNDEANPSQLNNTYYLDANHANVFDAFDIHVGGNANIAIVDDAVFSTHEDLASKIVSQRDEADNDFNANPPLLGGNHATNTHYSHGTHVAGIAAAETNNGDGISGTGHNNLIISVKARGDNNTTSGITHGYEGITWAATNNADVINCSWGGNAFSQAEHDVIAEARFVHDVVIIAAAGNSATATPHYPAAYGESTTMAIWEIDDRSMVIAVAALDQNSDISVWGSGMFGSTSGSNFGQWVDISAYGTDIFSTVAFSDFWGNTEIDHYEFYNGTSMATPQISGIAGLMRSFDPTKDALEIYNCLVYTANPDIYDAGLHPNNNPNTLGTGRVDAEAALLCLTEDCAFAPQAVIFPSEVSLCPGSTVTLSANNGISWVWSTTEITQSIDVNTADTYSVTVTYSGGCISTTDYVLNDADLNAHIVIIENSGLAPNDGILCGQDMLQLSSYWGLGYQWDGFGGNFTGPAIPGTINAGGNANLPFAWHECVTITGVGGCPGITDVACVDIEWKLPPTAIIVASNNPICPGDISTLTASGGLNYLWSTGETTEIINVSPASNTTYNVTVIDEFGCTDEVSITITVYPEVFVSILTTTDVCSGDCDGTAVSSVIGGTGSGTYTILWSNGQTTPIATGLCEGTHTITVTDANGCSATADAIINEYPEMLSAVTVTNGCSSGSGQAEISVSGGIANYTYQLSDLTPPYALFFPTNTSNTTHTYTGLSDGDYSYTITDGNTCTTSGIFSINSLPVPDASFTTDPCMFQGLPMQFINTLTDPSFTYEWDFGNGNTSSIENPTSSFSHDGYYCVSSTVTNSCGTDTYTETVYIYPDQCACPTVYTYTIPDGYTAFNGEVWGTGTTVEGDVFVNANVLLTINGTVKFGPKGRILVKQYGDLKIVSGSVLTTLDVPCEYMWQGIEVWGQPMMNSYWAAQGHISIGNATIEKAHIGVLLGARNEDIICDPSHFLGPFNSFVSGGVISAQEADFRDNGISIKFVIKKNRHSFANSIVKCDFYGNTLIDPNYNSSSTYRYPNANYPYNGNHNTFGRSTVGVWQERLEGIQFSNNYFDNHQISMESYNAKYDVFGSEFYRTRFGIYISNTSISVDNRHEIGGCTFNNIPGNTLMKAAAIYINGGRFDYIHDCEFGNTDLGTFQSNNVIGIYTRNASGYDIVDNDFGRFKTGIYTYKTNFGGGFIGNEDEHVGNEFEEVRRSIVTSNTNIKLCIRCNTHDDPVLSNYQVNWHNSGNLADQGWPTPPLSSNPAYYPAGNLFLTGNRQQIQSPNDHYNYYHHMGPWYAKPQALTPITPYSNGVMYVPNRACPIQSIIQPLVLTNRIDSLDIVIEQNIIDYNLFKTTLDNGITLELLDDIYGNLSGGVLKNKLISNSPLSDTILISLIAEDVLSHGDFKLVMQQNLPVSEKVEPYFLEKVSSLPNGIANQLMDLLGIGSSITTLTTFQRNIELAEQLKQLYVSDLVGYYSDTNQIADAIQLLENIGDMNSETVLIGTYLLDSNIIDAETKLANLPVYDYATYEWVEYYYMLINIMEEGRTLYQLTPSELTFINDLAYRCPGGLATSNAQAILALIYGERFDLCEEEEMGTRSQMVQNDSDKENKPFDPSVFLGDNYPNPFSNSTIIPFKIPEEYTGEIKVYNAIGEIIGVYTINGTMDKLEINSKKYAPGVYTYSLILNGEYVDTKRMTIFK